ncbi:hypothetical protein ASPCAL05169 [Aspergillus calidoustus]|uniref:Uncharacterized protein n=1 Tax=Aspergillus calidoustus TaxID=454130 RepID=A0A0U5FXH6_ASPCI|nr:hypothetical protein ASPCAL05169 [Aspergillus calidoustus]
MRGSVHFASPPDPNVPSSSSHPIHSDRPGFTNSDPLPKAERAPTGLLAFVAMVDADSQNRAFRRGNVSEPRDCGWEFMSFSHFLRFLLADMKDDYFRVAER